MIFLNLSNGFWVKKFFKNTCIYFVRFQSNHLQWVKEFDFWDYNLVYSLLLGRTYIFDWTIWNKYLADWLKQFVIWFIVFLFYFRMKIWFSKKEFLENKYLFRDFLKDRFVFLSEVSQQYKSKLIASIIDYVYNFFDVRDNIKIKNKKEFLKHMENFRKYFWGDKWNIWWYKKKFDLNYKIYFFSEVYDNFFDKFRLVKKKLPDRFLFIWNIKNFYLDDKPIEIF